MKQLLALLLVANTCLAGGTIRHGTFRHGSMGKNPPAPFSGPYPSQLVFAIDATASGAISGSNVSDVYTTSGVVATPLINDAQGVAYITNYLGQSAMYVNASDGMGSDTMWSQYIVRFAGTTLNNAINFFAAKGVMAWKVYVLPANTAGFMPTFFETSDGGGISCGAFLRDDGIGNWTISDAQLVTIAGGVNYNAFTPVTSIAQDTGYHWMIAQWDTVAGTWSFYEDNNTGTWYYDGNGPVSINPAASFVIGRSAACFTQKFFYWQGVNLTPADVANLVNNF